MKVSSRKILAIMFSTMLLAGLGMGCTSSKEVKEVKEVASSTQPSASSSAGKPLPPMELKFLMRGTEPNQMKAVLEEMGNRLKDTLNVKITMDWVPIPDQKTKLQLALASKDDYAGYVDAPFINYNSAVGNKYYAELDSYFLNDKYPGLKQEYSKEVVENMKDNGHNYAIPLSRGFASMRYFLIRKDLREKYGMPEIKSQADLEKFFGNVLKNEKGVIPITGGPLAVGGFETGMLPRDFYLKYKDQCTDGYSAALPNLYTPVCLSEDHKKVVGIYFPGDSEDKYKDFPAEWKSNLTQTEKVTADWYKKGYMNKDVMIIKDTSQDFYAGKYAATSGDNPSSNLNAIKKTLPNASLEIVSISERRDLPPASSETNYRANNFIVIPTFQTKEKIERTMMFFDWLFAKPENHDLLELGIQGKNWEPVGDKKFKIPQGVEVASNYNFPPYRMTWSSRLTRTLDGQSAMYDKIDSWLTDPKSTYLTPLKGFVFNTEPVKTEIAKISPVFIDEGKPIRMGTVPDVDAAYKKLNEKAEQLGLEKLRAEVIKQIEAYLAAH